MFNVQSIIEDTVRKCLVRINDFHSGLWKDDIKAVFYEKLEGIVLPKVETAAEVLELADILNNLKK